jgi:hypothetical protein
LLSYMWEFILGLVYIGHIPRWWFLVPSPEVMSGDTWSCQNWRQQMHAADIYWVETRYAAQHLAMQSAQWRVTQPQMSVLLRLRNHKPRILG